MLYFYLDIFLRLSHHSISISHKNDLELEINENHNFKFKINLPRFLDLSRSLNSKLHQELQQLNDQLPNAENEEQFKQWWQANGKSWTENLREIMIKYCNIGHDWQFSKQQKELLEQYYYANQLLTQCLHQDCYVSPEVRQEIEETLLLPIDVIRSRQSEKG